MSFSKANGMVGRLAKSGRKVESRKETEEKYLSPLAIGGRAILSFRLLSTLYPSPLYFFGYCRKNRGERIRTSDPLLPKQVR